MTLPYEPLSIASMANGRPKPRRTPKQVFVDLVDAKLLRDSLQTGYGLTGLQRQRGAEAAYEHIVECESDWLVDHRAGKRLVREAMRPKNGIAAFGFSPFIFFLAAILWDIAWWIWTRRK